MSTSLTEKKYLQSGLSVAHFVFSAILVLALGLCSVGSVRAQDPVTGDAQGFVGIKVEDSTSPRGAKVVNVVPDSHAQHAGIKPGNVIVTVNKMAITSSDDFYRATAGLSAGTFMDIGVIQNSAKVTRGVRVAYPPGSKQAVPSFKGTKKQVFGYREGTAGEQPPKSPSGSASGITIIDLVVSQDSVAPDTVFGLSMDLFAENAQEKSGNVKITMRYAVKKDGRVLTAADPEKLTLPNGMPVNIIRKCRAPKEPGSYEIFITLEMAHVQTGKSVAFVVK